LLQLFCAPGFFAATGKDGICAPRRKVFARLDCQKHCLAIGLDYFLSSEMKPSRPVINEKHSAFAY